jgi:heat shock protein HtpX
MLTIGPGRAFMGEAHKMSNIFKTALLLGVLTAMLVLIGGAIGGQQGMIVAFFLALAMNFFSYWFSDKMVLAMYRAQPLDEASAPMVHRIVRRLATRAGIPMPRIYLIPTDTPNAFATGRNPEHSSIAVTRGLLDMMNRVELEGVVAHELSHVRDRDILVGTVVATLVGTVVLISEFFLRWFWWGGMGGRRGDDRSGGGLEAIFFVIGLVLLILAPIVGQIIKFAVSRRREYLADAEGAMLTRYPPGLAAALRKVAASDHAMRSANNATAHLWLDQPSRVPGEKMSSLEKLFSTHPPIQDRIRILEEM